MIYNLNQGNPIAAFIQLRIPLIGTPSLTRGFPQTLFGKFYHRLCARGYTQFGINVTEMRFDSSICDAQRKGNLLIGFSPQ